MCGGGDDTPAPGPVRSPGRSKRGGSPARAAPSRRRERAQQTREDVGHHTLSDGEQRCVSREPQTQTHPQIRCHSLTEHPGPQRRPVEGADAGRGGAGGIAPPGDPTEDTSPLHTAGSSARPQRRKPVTRPPPLPLSGHQGPPPDDRRPFRVT